MTTQWIFLGTGGLVVLLALALVYRGTPVTTGHAIMVGFGGALMALPVVSNFEWTEKGFKFTTKAEGYELAEQVKNLVQENIAIRQQLTGIGKASQASLERLTAVERAASETSSSFRPPAIGTVPYAQPSFFDELERRNADANSDNTKQLESIQTLQERLTPNLAQDRLFLNGLSR